MIKTPEHQALIDAVAAAEADLRRAKLALRSFRHAHLKKTRPPRQTTEERVLLALSTVVRKRPAQIAQEVGRTPQGVRLVLMRLVAEGRARRLGRPMQHTFYMAVPQKEAAE